MRTGSVLRNQRVSPKPGLPSGFPLGSPATIKLGVTLVPVEGTIVAVIKSGQFVQGITL